MENFKTKYGVQILYDNTLITDDIFPIQENTTIEIKGKESNAKAVSLHIKQFLYNLKVISIYLLEEDYFILRQKICNIKNNVHPADLRLRKLDSKNEREIIIIKQNITKLDTEKYNIKKLNEVNEELGKVEDMLKIKRLSYLFHLTKNNPKIFQKDIDPEDVFYYLIRLVSSLFLSKAFFLAFLVLNL